MNSCRRLALINVIALGSQACRYVAEVVNEFPSLRIGGSLLQPVFIDADHRSLNSIPEAMQRSFFLLPTDPQEVKIAAKFPEDRPWPYMFGPPELYRWFRGQIGGGHRPNSVAIAFAADPDPVMDFVLRSRREGLAQQAGREVEEYFAVVLDPLGAVGAGLVYPFALELVARLKRTGVKIPPVVRVSSLLNPALVEASVLEDYKAKFFDDRCMASAISEGTIKAHLSERDLPFDLEVFLNTGRRPEVQSLPDHRAVMGDELAALFAAWEHLWGKAIDAPEAGLERDLEGQRRQDGNQPARPVVLFGAETVEHDPTAAAGIIRNLAVRHICMPLLHDSGATDALSPAVARAVDQLKGAAASFMRDSMRASVQRLDSVSAQSSPAAALGESSLLEQVEDDARAAVGDVDLGERQILRACAMAASLSAARNGMNAAAELLAQEMTSLQKRLEQRREEASVARTFVQQYGEHPDMRREVSAQLRVAVEALVAIALLEAMLEMLEEWSQQLISVEETILALAQVVQEIVSDARVLPPSMRPGREPLLPASAHEEELDSLAQLSSTQSARAELLGRLLTVEPSREVVRSALSEFVRERCGQLLSRSTFEWAMSRFQNPSDRRLLIERMGRKLALAPLMPTPRKPLRMFVPMASSTKMHEFARIVQTEVPATLHSAGDQPETTMEDESGNPKLVFWTAWIGLRSIDLEITHWCREAWRERRTRGNFPFTIRAQEVLELPEVDIPVPSPEPPQEIEPSRTTFESLAAPTTAELAIETWPTGANGGEAPDH